MGSAASLIKQIKDQLRNSGNQKLRSDVDLLIKYTEALEQKVSPLKRPKIVNGVLKISPGKGTNSGGPAPRERKELKERLQLNTGMQQELLENAFLLIGYTEELERLVPELERPD